MHIPAAIRGVNLGGWLLAEPWMTPSLFEGSGARDEYGLSQMAGGAGRDRLRKHHAGFITADDFAWVAQRGLNAVRIPVGYWLFGDVKPFAGAATHLDNAMSWAEQHGLRVLISLHGAPGSQNGRDHSGRCGAVGWPVTDHVAETLVFVERLAERYGQHAVLYGIELLNEPSPQLADTSLQAYYELAHAAIRQHARPEVRVVISDSLQPQPDRWRSMLPPTTFAGSMLDLHSYQCFGEADKQLNIYDHVMKTVASLPPLLRRVGHSHPVIVGEWSAALDPRSLAGLDEPAREAAYQAYVGAQLLAFSAADGWYYWSYKTESDGPWNFRWASERGWFPATL